MKRPVTMCLVFPLMGVILLQCNPAFAISTDTVVLAGDSIILNCSGSIINWYHYPLRDKTKPMDVFMNGRIRAEYRDLGFRIDGNKNPHDRNLIIENVTTDLAGIYECNEIDKEKNSTELIVLENLPECDVNMDEFIGPNDCNLPPDDILLSCSVRYSGCKAPELEWTKHGGTIEVLESKCTTESDNLTRCKTTVKPDVGMNGSSFVCQTTKRAAKEQYNCTANITVLYSFSSEESQSTAVRGGDSVDCVANSSQSCTYKWVWYEKVGNDLSRTIESTNNVLIAKKIGLHRCEAQCNLRNQTCLLFPKFINVTESENRPESNRFSQSLEQENKQWTPAVIGLIILGVLPYIAFGCYLFTQMRRQKPADDNQTTTSETVQLADMQPSRSSSGEEETEGRIASGSTCAGAAK